MVIIYLFILVDKAMFVNFVNFYLNRKRKTH